LRKKKGLIKKRLSHRGERESKFLVKKKKGERRLY